MSSTRAGIGYDVHRLVEGRKLILGGVEIPFEKGLMGHSDSDVLSHAICDALLGAAALGDIGAHFPDSDPQWKNASSLEFLSHAVSLIRDAGYRIENIDATVIAERPKLAPHIRAVRERLSTVLQIDVERISVKAKTTEGLDAVGRGEAIACQAVAVIAMGG
jgi:2-C-methyl-D-erythritol 2,4-cyclodiphosphate synthase